MSFQSASSSRLFIAVPVSQQVANTLSNWVLEHQKKLSFRKWTHPADYHITLQFLGDTPAHATTQLIESLQQIAYDPFTLSLDQIGVFGPKASPRILWASVQDPDQSLKRLQELIIEQTAPLGFIPEKREFRAHLTLARDYRGNQDFQLSDLSELQHSSSWQVDHFSMMKSNLKSSPMYQIVQSFPF